MNYQTDITEGSDNNTDNNSEESRSESNTSENTGEHDVGFPGLQGMIVAQYQESLINEIIPEEQLQIREEA